MALVKLNVFHCKSSGIRLLSSRAENGNFRC
jgi:hypothetical protein